MIEPSDTGNRIAANNGDCQEGLFALAVDMGHGSRVARTSNTKSAGQGQGPLLLPGRDPGCPGQGMDADGGGGDLCSAWGDWLEQIGADLQGWDWFATFTFRDPTEAQQLRYPGWTRIGWGFAHSALRKWDSALISARFGRSQAYYVAMMELQHWRGVPHWHLLVGNTGNERRMDWVDWWWSHFGIARVLPYDPGLGARYYLGKYLTKEMADIQTSPQLRASHRRAVARISMTGSGEGR